MGPGNSRKVSFDEVVNLMPDGPAHPELEVHGTVTGLLPASGRPHDTVSLERNRDYPADSDLCFGIGNSVTRVRLTAGDLEKVRAVLGLHGLTFGDIIESGRDDRDRWRQPRLSDLYR